MSTPGGVHSMQHEQLETQEHKQATYHNPLVAHVFVFCSQAERFVPSVWILRNDCEAALFALLIQELHKANVCNGTLYILYPSPRQSALYNAASQTCSF